MTFQKLIIGYFLIKKTIFQRKHKKNRHTNVNKNLALYNNFLKKMIIENLPIPKVVQENLTDMIKLYIRYGPDYSLISKEFEGIVQQKISAKFISQFCFNLNKKTYEIIVDYLKEHKEQKGQKEFNYDNLWPNSIDDPELRTEIQNLPTDIIKILNKDLSEAYNLLMESLSDPTLKKLLKYDRIRDLYQFVTEIILKKKNRVRKERKDKKDPPKEITQKKQSQSKVVRVIEQTSQQSKVESSTEWSFIEERYFCVLYLSRPLLQCCQKMKEKFGESQKWNTTKKIFRKAEQVFTKGLKKALKSSYFKSLKHIIDEIKTSRDNLIGQVMKKKSNQLQKIVLKYYRTNDSTKKSHIMQQIRSEILNILQKPEITKRQPEQRVKLLKQEHNIKQEEKPLPVNLSHNSTPIIEPLSVFQIKLQTVDVNLDYIQLQKKQ